MAESDALRQHLLDLLRGRNAHADFDAVVVDFPSRLRGVKPPGAPHSAWQLLEHMRMAQWDILEFSRNAILQFLVFCALPQMHGPNRTGTRQDFIDLYQHLEGGHYAEIKEIVTKFKFKSWKIVPGHNP